MHLLQAQHGVIDDGASAVDLGQTPADIIFLSSADTELACIAAAHRGQPEDCLTLRLANIMQLSHNLSVDLYVENIIARARIVVVRLLGGVRYWPYGVERVVETCRARGIPLALLPGDEQPDPELGRLSTLAPQEMHRLWQYCIQGGEKNARSFLGFCASLLGRSDAWLEPLPLLRAGLWWFDLSHPDMDAVRKHWREGAPVAAIVFYRALLQAETLAPIEALVTSLTSCGMNPLPVFTVSLKEPMAGEIVHHILEKNNPDIILNTTGFAVSLPEGERQLGPFDGLDVPVLQVMFSGETQQAWRDGVRGLAPRDIAMAVALPEVDGRLITRAVSFKAPSHYDEKTQCTLSHYETDKERACFIATLAARWVRLRKTPADKRRLVLMLANYPNRDGRLGNGVGLDTPAALIKVLHALKQVGYDVADIPPDGEALMAALAEGPTNAGVEGRIVRETYSLDDYQKFFKRLPEAIQESLTARWGTPEKDPFFLKDQQAFALAVMRCGAITLAVQPARGYNIDPVSSYHDPALPPPHGYVALYGWLREKEKSDAVVQMGKHGNLEWLPGKAVALSEACFPEAVFGPLPHIYPFIVNDPGEGTQAKRRAQAVIIDHLTPPLTRAESYGPYAELERLVDEYYGAASADPRRLDFLENEIIGLSQRIGLDRDCGMETSESRSDALACLDNYLCELKEMQIRGGLHVFGVAPKGERKHDLITALLRTPRGEGHGGDASLHRALADDLGLEKFDPLDCVLGEPWQGPRPDVLATIAEGPWRHKGDSVERIEALALALVSGERAVPLEWRKTTEVLAHMEEVVAPAIETCGECEVEGLLAALEGRFVMPGPSGAPTRGRFDVLPTGRNFYSVDSRSLPTAAAWRLGWESAELLMEHYRQSHGEWPRAMAISAWGTANMRTGGDDIAQALALMGVRPRWDDVSGRVAGFEILPLSLLARPRVDVTLRVSGFFRDAFPTQIDLFDSAARAVAALDEPPEDNSLASQVHDESVCLIAQGMSETESHHRAGFRVFGSHPGAYGAGLQALIDEKGWQDDKDLARAYVAWGGYAYGVGAEGIAMHGLFEQRLAKIQAVIQNQDNREHDLLDSDDYYQFEGGLAASVRHFSGAQPTLYHNDHSRPERPVIRTLNDEIARVVRARATNSKWITGIMEHGYKGAFEMAATVDYLFAFAATAQVVADYHFDLVYEAYLESDDVLEFLRTNNPAALQEMATRFCEALERELWRPASNSAHERLKVLASGDSRRDKTK
ncbi:MAG: cobaltochelatase subunit CobN [Parvularculales bacterium]